MAIRNKVKASSSKKTASKKAVSKNVSEVEETAEVLDAKSETEVFATPGLSTVSNSARTENVASVQKIINKINAKNKKKKPDKRPDFELGIADPSDLLAVAEFWVDMPFPWQELTGVRGIPFGHVTTIQGLPDSGKSTIAMHAMVEAQLKGVLVVLIDTEFKFNMARFKNMGGDPTHLLKVSATTLEGGFAGVDEVIDAYKSENPDQPILFVWDSLGMTPTDAEVNGDSSKVSVAEAARVIKKNIRREMAKIHKTKTALIFINHVYKNINAMFGNSTKGYGGDGPGFSSVLVLEAAPIKKIMGQKSGKKFQKAVVSKIKCTKNHLSAVQGGVAEVKIGPVGIITGDTQLSVQDDDDESDSDYV